MLCKHTKFYLFKKRRPRSGRLFNEVNAAVSVALKNQKLHITLHRLASAY